MDRRYSQAQGAVKVERSKELAQRFLGEARRRYSAAQNYGTSAPRNGSADPAAGLMVLSARAETSQEQRKFYDSQGFRELKGRSEFNRARQGDLGAEA